MSLKMLSILTIKFFILASFAAWMVSGSGSGIQIHSDNLRTAKHQTEYYPNYQDEQPPARTTRATTTPATATTENVMEVSEAAENDENNDDPNTKAVSTIINIPKFDPQDIPVHSLYDLEDMTRQNYLDHIDDYLDDEARSFNYGFDDDDFDEDDDDEEDNDDSNFDDEFEEEDFIDFENFQKAFKKRNIKRKACNGPLRFWVGCNV